MRRQVAVLGLGRFGQAVARELTRLGHDVLAIDADERIVQDIADEVTHAVQADVTDREALQSLGVGDFETAIVSVSGKIEANILATVIVRELGVSRIIAKAAHELHGRILAQVGAHRVVYPERETGVRVAHSFAAPGVQDYLDVGPGYGFARVAVGPDWVGRTFGELNLQRSCGVAIMALARADGIMLHPSTGETIRRGDALIVAGRDEDLERLPGGSRDGQ